MMDRQGELAAIEAHIETKGVYRCSMGESYYGDDGLTPKMMQEAFYKRQKAKAKFKTCAECGERFRDKCNGQKFCSPECRKKAPPNRNRTGAFADCHVCGKRHYRRKHQLSAIRYFCSTECLKNRGKNSE